MGGYRKICGENEQETNMSTPNQGTLDARGKVVDVQGEKATRHIQCFRSYG